MFAILSRLFSNLLIGGCFFALTFVLFSLGGLLRLLPRLLSFLRGALRWFLILSARFYGHILTPLSPGFQQSGIGRIIATTLFSLAVGITASWLINNAVPIWIAVLSGLHGLVVGLAWDELLNPGGLYLGVNIS